MIDDALAPARDPERVAPDLHEFLTGQQRFADEVSRVWAGQIESSRAQMDTAVADLTVRFSGIVARLDTMLADYSGDRRSARAGIDAQAADICQASERRLTHVVDSLRQAMDSKAEMFAQVQGLQGFLADLGRMAAAISRIAQQTHLLSINAAIEAAHAGASGSGFAVVAQEVRSLSKMSADTGTDIARTVQTIQNAIRSTQTAAEESARRDAQTMLESEQRIREVIGQFGDLTGSMRDVVEAMRSESRGIKAEVDEAIFQLQFQDRIGQVMAHVRQNIELLPDLQRRNAVACERAGRPVPLDPQPLLTELASTYAMVDEHRIHEGRTPAAASADNEVTFF
ncbi:MAG: methyl-accepting chemotaxis protein [Burkholderiaceae bacterium]